MKELFGRLFIYCSMVILAVAARATIRYVDANGTNPVSPYTDWSTAATNIQDAIDAAIDGDLVMVTNGIYADGGRVVYGSLTNRVVIDKALTVQSVNGPDYTAIQGYQNSTNYDYDIRCVYMTNAALLAGFTIGGGGTRSSIGDLTEAAGGGVYCESTNTTVTNCVLVGNLGVWGGGGIYQGTLNNCVLSNNATINYSAPGGAAYKSVLNNCLISSNSSCFGGGAAYSVLNHCSVVGNATPNRGSTSLGGGTYMCWGNYCTIAGNFSWTSGGGDCNGTLNYCIISNNVCAAPAGYGQGAGSCQQSPNGSYTPMLNGCLIVNNFSYGNGGGVYTVGTGPVLTNCTIAGNTATNAGGGVYYGVLKNCIVYGNYATAFTGFSSNVYQASLTSCWTNDPLFVNPVSGDFHLKPSSPCINAGNNNYVAGTNDLDGNLRIVYGTVDIGAYESPYNSKTHYVSLTSTNPVSPFNDWTIAATNIQDAVDAATEGDSIWVTNGVYKIGGRKANGYSLTNRVVVGKPVTLQSVNGPANTFIQGFSPVGNTAVRCVYLTNGAVLSGFTLTNGATLNSGNSTYEQSGGGVLCESTKAVVTNCVIVGCAAVNGGGAEGGALNTCTIMRNTATYGGGIYGSNSILNAATISNFVNSSIIVSNYASSHGGGAFGSTLDNCLISSNSVGLYTGGGAAYSSLNNCIVSNNAAPNYYGGGVSYSILADCLVVRNRSSSDGGGAYYSLMCGCTVVSNSVTSGSGVGGGTYQGTNYNCIVYYNSSPSSSNYYNSVSAYCDTMPLAAGRGNITNAPVFVNASAGNLHLQSTSPCINSGYNAYVLGTNDLDGNPRIVGGTVDMGAYEYQTPASVISYAWLQQYGLATDGSADYADTDGTGMNNWQKWIAGLNPTNSSSVLALLTPAATNTSNGITVTWQSVNTRTYFLQRSSDLSGQPPFSTIQSNIVGQAGTTSYTDSAATNNVPYFYRVGVQ